MTASTPVTSLVKAQRRAVLLVNVGTPDAPTVPAVRRYLAEFLNDPRVVDLPPLGRWLLLNLIILPFRPRRSAHAYQAIWTKDGSPLLLHSEAQRAGLEARLPEAKVLLAMRYGNPSLDAALEQVRGVEHLTVVPLYPQYAQATSGTTVEAVLSKLGRQVHPPSLTFTRPFHDDEGYLETWAEQVRATVSQERIDHVLFSYHGLPIRQLKAFCADACDGHQGRQGACGALGEGNRHCYRAQCMATSRAIAAKAGLSSSSTSFQSRLKGTTWMSPFTDEVVVSLAKQHQRIAVACPAFVADCLETLEEIGQRADESFRAAGGEKLVLVPSLNASPRFLDSLAALVRGSWASPA
jgi:ferrochelatase